MSDPVPAAHAPSIDGPLGATTDRQASPTSTSGWAVQCGRLLYTHNPFYLASAWMVFSGLRASFPANSGAIDAWSLTLCLMGYTVLLSLTAILVIRLGKVWDDARSLLLLIVLMFLGISVTFDGILAGAPAQASRYYLFGWFFSATISELLLRSLRLRFGWLFRLPFHLLLALFFFYPLVLAPRLATPHDPVLAWQLFGFSSVAALILLSLLPAVRRGPDYLAENGSPWQWPWFPWVLFGMLGFCVSLRAYYLCVSLHFVGSDNSIFAPYFLVPLGLAAIVLLLEAGLVVGSARVVRWALCMPLPLLLLAAMGDSSNGVAQDFLSLFEQTFGATPLYVTLWTVAGFYLLAAVRGVAAANYLLIGTLISLSVMQPWPVLPAGSGLNPLPLALAGAWQIAFGWRTRHSVDIVCGLCLSLIAAAIAGQDTWFGSLRGILPIHLLLIILLGAGYACQDQTGLYSRRLGIAIAVILSSVAALSDPKIFGNVPGWVWMLYPIAVAVLLAGYGRLTGDIWSYLGATAALTLSCVGHAGRLYDYLLHRVAGLNELAWGAVFFLLAALISLLKSGLYPNWLRRKLP